MKNFNLNHFCKQVTAFICAIIIFGNYVAILNSQFFTDHGELICAIIGFPLLLWFFWMFSGWIVEIDNYQQNSKD